MKNIELSKDQLKDLNSIGMIRVGDTEISILKKSFELTYEQQRSLDCYGEIHLMFNGFEERLKKEISIGVSCSKHDEIIEYNDRRTPQVAKVGVIIRKEIKQ